MYLVKVWSNNNQKYDEFKFNSLDWAETFRGEMLKYNYADTVQIDWCDKEYMCKHI